MDMGKSYNATITLGESTTTEDQTGEVIDKIDVQANAININEVDAVLKQFEGIIEQVPPMYSSVKVNGKSYMSMHVKVKLLNDQFVKVNIDSIARTSELQFEDGKCHFNIEVKCGKGTYIRTLATDIGKQLGYPAHMSLLTRINSGGFDIKDSITLDQISQLHEQDTLQPHLFPLEYGLKSLPKIYVSDENIKTRILNGQKFNKNNLIKRLNNNLSLLILRRRK